MKDSVIADNKSIRVKLEVGKTYYYCTCGRSKDQPFCDGSHQGTEFTPIKFVADREEASFCQCKQTKNAPYCDGSHRAFDDSSVGKRFNSDDSVK